MQLIKKFDAKYTFGILLIALAQMVSIGTSWILFNEVKPPKSLVK
ncbi:hypothetical protein PV797_02765 [Clostridiaceae bacterium M8S5]|nr:hypothetical protein PV797_02765 [Clostridiaceae bacterium M8S5]